MFCVCLVFSTSLSATCICLKISNAIKLFIFSSFDLLLQFNQIAIIILDPREIHFLKRVQGLNNKTNPCSKVFFRKYFFKSCNNKPYHYKEQYIIISVYPDTIKSFIFPVVI